MATDFTGLDINSYFKKRYGKYLSRIPTFAILRDKIGFDVSKRIGEEYVEQIELELEHGFTKRTGNSGSTADGFTLDAPIAGGSKRASLSSSVAVLRSSIGLRGLFASQGPDKEIAFRELTKNRVRGMWKSTNKRLEMDLLYGQCSDTANTDSGGLGKVASGGVSGNVITISDQSWAPAIWAGMKDALVEMLVPADPPTSRRQDVGTAPTGYTGGSIYTTITKVDANSKKLTLGSTIPTSTQAGDLIFLRGSLDGAGTTTASNWTEMVGLHRICSQVSASPTLFGIDPTVYDQWQPTTVNAGGSYLSFEIINDTVTKLIGKGLEGSVTVITSPFQWGKMMNDLGALRRIDYSQNSNKYVVGASEIEFYSANGKITVLAHPYVKAGMTYVTSIDNDDTYRTSDNDEGDSNMGAFARGGITDVTFNRPTGLVQQAQVSPKFFYETNNEYTVELRCVYDEFLFCNAVGHQALIFNLGGV